MTDFINHPSHMNPVNNPIAIGVEEHELIEMRNGVIRCHNTAKNWATVADWTIANDQVVVLMTTNGKYLNVELCGFSAGQMNSLLEHFDYQ